MSAPPIRTIVVIEPVNYSSLIEPDTEAMVRLAGLWGMIHAITGDQHYGRIPSWEYGKTVAGFEQPVEAASAAVEVQNSVRDENEKRPADQHILFRIGIDFGKATLDDRVFVGDAVAVAERLAAIASPGGIAMSGSAKDAVNASFYDESKRSPEDEWPALPGAFTRSTASYEAAKNMINASFYAKGERSLEGGLPAVQVFERAPSLATGSRLALSPAISKSNPVIVKRSHGASVPRAILSFLLFFVGVAVLWFFLRR